MFLGHIGMGPALIRAEPRLRIGALIFVRFSTFGLF